MVSNKNKKLFQETIKEAILKFKKVNFFGVIKFVGSINYENDIDIVFCPAPGIKTSEFFVAQVNFLEIVKKKFEKKSGLRLICFPFVSLQEEVEYISERKKGDIFLHIVNLYKNYKKMTGTKSFIADNRFILYGDSQTIKKVKTPKNERFFDYLYYSELFFANYPLSLLNKKIKSNVGRIYKFIGTKSDLKHSKELYSQEQLKKIYINCLKALD